MLQCSAVWCSVVQCSAVWCSVVQCGAAWCSVVQLVAGWCSVLLCVAVCCSVRVASFSGVQFGKDDGTEAVALSWQQLRQDIPSLQPKGSHLGYAE